MSGYAWFSVGCLLGSVAWLAYRWFRPSASQRAMRDMADCYALRAQKRQHILSAVNRGEITAREAHDRLMRL